MVWFSEKYLMLGQISDVWKLVKIFETIKIICVFRNLHFQTKFEFLKKKMKIGILGNCFFLKILVLGITLDFGKHFEFWMKFPIFRILIFLGKNCDFVNFLDFFLEMSCISEWFRFSDVFWGGFQFFWTNCRNSSWNLWTNFWILTKKRLYLWNN